MTARSYTRLKRRTLRHQRYVSTQRLRVLARRRKKTSKARDQRLESW